MNSGGTTEISVLEEPDWRDRERRHGERLRPWTEAVRTRHNERRAHPVHDFLFTYYSYRPSRLEQWHPPLGTALRFSNAATVKDFLRNRRYSVRDDAIQLDPAKFTARETKTCQWIAQLLRDIESRPARFGCAGLHEWAMLYAVPPEEVRHERFPLRLSLEEIAEVVRANRIGCTHYDAFRFFSEAARPLNAWQPSRETMGDLEQGGCLHTNMDLYKWAYKLAPWIGSDLIAEAFFLAAAGRELDMRASPYDLGELGFEPVPVENAEGRRRYELLQRALSEKAAPLRIKLIAACEDILERTG